MSEVIGKQIVQAGKRGGRPGAHADAAPGWHVRQRSLKSRLSRSASTEDIQAHMLRCSGAPHMNTRSCLPASAPCMEEQGAQFHGAPTSSLRSGSEAHPVNLCHRL